MTMKPILLKGHDRPISDVKFNFDGDLIFSASKDGSVQVWDSETGERLGTYECSAAVNSISINREATQMLSAHADGTAALWEVETGKKIGGYKPHEASVKSITFSEGDRTFLAITDQQMGQNPFIQVYNLGNRESDKPVLQVESKSGRINKAIWGYHNQSIITANDDGTVRIYDSERIIETKKIEAHEKPVMTIQADYYNVLFITASKDGTSKLWDRRTCECIRTYEIGRPLNAAAISPLMDHIIIGGGESAMEVTQTVSTAEQFKIRFFHSILSYELGSVLGHFGPVNALDFSPDGKSFVSGSEDGFCRVHFLPDSYFNRPDEMRIFSK